MIKERRAWALVDRAGRYHGQPPTLYNTKSFAEFLLRLIKTNTGKTFKVIPVRIVPEEVEGEKND